MADRAFAQGTSVPRAEIERVLSRYGATRFGTMTDPHGATVYFEHGSRQIQLRVPMPDKGDKRFTHEPARTWKRRTETERDARWQAEYRRRWRVLVITVKAMLEAVESKVLTFDEAFLAHIVIPGTGKTLGAAIVPKLDALYEGLSLPALLTENP